MQQVVHVCVRPLRRACVHASELGVHVFTPFLFAFRQKNISYHGGDLPHLSLSNSTLQRLRAKRRPNLTKDDLRLNDECMDFGHAAAYIPVMFRSRRGGSRSNVSSTVPVLYVSVYYICFYFVY